MDLYHWENHKAEHLEEFCIMLLRDDPKLFRLLLGEDDYYAIDDVDAGRLGISLVHNTRLERLSLKFHQNLSRRGAKVLASGIRQSKLEWLSIHFQPTYDPEVMRIIYDEGVMRSKSIWHLEGIESVGSIDAFCRTLRSIQVLELHYYDVRSAVMERISHSLSINKSIQRILFKNCDIGIREMRMLSSSLRQNSSIKQIGIVSNDLDDEEVAIFVENWQDDSPIEEIDFSYNNFGINGTMNLLQAVPSHRSLKNLDLTGIKLGLDGTQLMSELLPRALPLKGLSISSCLGLIDDCYEDLEEDVKPRVAATGQALLDGVIQNLHLQDFCLDYNCFPGEITDKIGLYVGLNKFGRYLMTEDGIPPGLWSYVLALCDGRTSEIYFFLTEQPHLMSFGGNRAPSKERDSKTKSRG